MDQRRKPYARNGVAHAGPYIWVSWLTRLLSGEETCRFRLWYRAQHKYDKVPDDPERAEFFDTWTKKHDALVQDRAHRLRDEGWVVKVEDEGEFNLVGDNADLAGKPDIVALKGDEALVIDAKSGRKRSSDHWQVLVYAFALPLAWLKGTSYQIRGEVEYPDGAETVRPLGSVQQNAIIGLIRTASLPEQPPASPSERECRYCDISACVFRFKSVTGDARGYF